MGFYKTVLRRLAFGSLDCWRWGLGLRILCAGFQCVELRIVTAGLRLRVLGFCKAAVVLMF